ncbi:FAD-dependent oxidoreductase, partial [Microvirga sp. 3-52]|nr:FAD-dependent oxidoreductase [Microvirga sp. 3-52]
TKVGGPSPDKFGEKRNISILTRHDATSINRETKTVQVQNLETDEVFTLEYDKLILSTGGKSRIPDIKGIGKLPLITLKSYTDMEYIQEFIEREQPKSCAIIGGGFIGVELAENFRHLGIKTALIERNDRVMKAMDREISDILYKEMADNGVEFYFNDEIERVEDKKLIMKNGMNFDVDFVAASIGIIPNTSLAEEIGLTIGETKGIVVNDYMQSSDPDIYAIGDVAETSDWHTGKPKMVQLAWHAHRQAYIVASHLNGKPVKINGFLGSTITKL